MSFSRFRLLAFIGALATASALLFSTGAFAATPGIHVTPSTQSAKASAELRSAMEAQLRYNPSGRVINSHQISYDQGRIVITIVVPGVTPDYTCTKGYMCLWEGQLLTGSFAQINEPIQKNISIRAYLPVVHSIHNLRSTGSLITNGKKGRRARDVCYPSGARAMDVSAPVDKWPYLWLEKVNNCN